MPLRFFMVFVLALTACTSPVAPEDASTEDAAVQPDAFRVHDVGMDAPNPRVSVCNPAADPPGPYPAANAFPPSHGPGLGTVDTTAHPIGTNCAFLDGGDMDVMDHHNLGVMYDGYFLLPWAPETGAGGLSFYDVSHPCAPTMVGVGTSHTMRETHAIGFSSYGGRFAVVDQMTAIFHGGGIQFWDVSSVTAPRAIADLELPHFGYPDSYARPTLSVFWQGSYVFVGAADTGVHVVDAADPAHPAWVTTIAIDPVLRVGQVQAIGNLLVVTAAEGPRTALFDISDPEHPQPVPGGDFEAVDSTGEARDAYFTSATGGYVFYARKEGGGGLMVMDIHDPTRPVYAADRVSDGNGGYVFVHEGYAFVGESSVARIYDVRDLFDADPERVIPAPIQELRVQGDLDFAVPFGQLVLLSVDENAMPDQASAIVPWTSAADTTPPVETWVWPPDTSSPLASTLPVTSRFGVTFSEMIMVESAWEGSVRLYRADAASPDAGRVAGIVSAQEHIVSFVPLCPLEAGVEYVLEMPAGGLHDVSGNALGATITHRFHT
jgi:hypothetical protein